MQILRREFNDGPEAPELVLLHAVIREDAVGLQVFTTVAIPRGGGRREARLFLPDAPSGGRLRLEYRFSTVRGGRMSFSPLFTVDLAGDEARADLLRVGETGGGNLPPAPGRRMFRLPIPLRASEPRGGPVRFGFGAMRKKPSLDLCRASLSLAEAPAVIEAPEALSVLKNRPMPYFLYHWTGEDGGLTADKIASVRVPFRDDAGDIAWVWLLWADPDWVAPNVALMELRGVDAAMAVSEEDFIAEDPAGAVSRRREAKTGVPVPRTHEAYVFGPSGRTVEYCFLAVRRGASGEFSPAWVNRDGGNWIVEL